MRRYELVVGMMNQEMNSPIHIHSAGRRCACLASILVLVMPTSGDRGSETKDHAASLSDARLQAVLDGFEARRDKILHKQVEDTFPGPAAPEQMQLFAWNKLCFALAAMFRNERLPEANQAVIDVRKAMLAPDGRLENSEFGFYWASPQLFRIHELFHAKSPHFPGRLTPDAEKAIHELYWGWARGNARIADAATQPAWKPWQIYMSENHEAMRDAASWSAAHILRGTDSFRELSYDDGSTAKEQYQAWNRFLHEYLRERGRKGLLLEIASNTYSGYTLQCWYNYHDFATDPVLRMLAESMLHLWWADTAMEYLDGVRGGSKARQKRIHQHSGMADDVASMAAYYFGTGEPSPHPNMLALATSSYRPPLVVADIALDREGRGTYVYQSRRQGLNLMPRPAEAPPAFPATWESVLDPDFGGILRHTYVTPDFIMGTSMLEKRPKEHWASISDQDRWQGVIFRGHPDARIFPQATATGEHDRGNNEQWSVQSKGTLIVQKLDTSVYTADDMRVYFWKELRRTEDAGWVFVEAPHAYAAVRPVDGAFTWEGDDCNWMRLEKEYSPVIIEVARHCEFDDFAAFRKAVLANPFSYRDGVLEYTGLRDSGRFTFFAKSGEPPQINGSPVQYAPAFTYQSPFVTSTYPADQVTIRKGHRSLILDFSSGKREN